MPLNLPNLDRIAKDDIKVEEALKKIQDYSNQNVTTASGNAVPAPPATTTPPASQSTNPNTSINNPAIPQPPVIGVRGIDQL